MSPLEGIRVVALEQAVAAPFCSRQLADLGADVIKIERPDGGDLARGYDGALNGLSAYFAWLNRGKRSIALDVKRKPDVLHRLISRADVFVHNLAMGAVERLGFGFDALAVKHPQLVWCGISGYGTQGPYRDRKAYDMLVQAESGVISVTGTEEHPAKVGISIGDISAGMYAYSSILAALIGRGRNGRGERIDISMLECLTEWMMPPIYVWKGTGKIPARTGIRHNMIVPYGAYQCRDGSVMFAIQGDREWRRFCESVMPELGEERFRTNEMRLAQRAEVESRIEENFSRHAVNQVAAMLERAEIAMGVVNDVPAVAAHPQLASRWTEVDSGCGKIPAMFPPHRLSSVTLRMGRVPSLGEHTEEILREIGE